MVHWPSVVLSGLLALLSPAGLAPAQPVAADGGSVVVLPPSDWVVPVGWNRDVPPEPSRGTEGTRYLLFDLQAHPGRDEEYKHVVVRLLNETGVEDFGSLSFNFDPDYQELRLHLVRVHRGDQILERLDLSKVRVLQPERELDSGIYTGQHTATLVLEDLRVGDVLEYAVTTHGRNPVVGEHYSTRIHTRWSTALDRQFYRVIWPADRPLRRRNHLTDIEPETRSGSEGRELVWELDGQPALDTEDYLPASYEPFPYVELSDFDSWAQVVDWALALYPRDDSLLSAEMRELVSGWRTSGGSADDRARLALEFVQDDIRYMGMEFGPNSLRPSLPEETLERRFGDCKDKAYLLCLLLGAMDIEAYPVLVNSSVREAVARRLPSPFAFNHVIVKLLLDGEPVWVDPTIQYQRGSIFRRHVPRYGHGLVIRTGEKGLETVQPPQTQQGLQEVTSNFTIRSYEAPASLVVTTTFHGGEADSMRDTLARTEIESLGDSYLNFYSRDYPRIRAEAPPEVEDRESENVLTVIERYEIPDLWEYDEDAQRWVAYFYPESMDTMLPDPASRLREMPLAISFPRRKEHEIVVRLPDRDWEVPPENITVKGPGFRFRYRRRGDGQTVRFLYDCETTAAAVAPGDVSEYLEKLEEMDALLGDSLYRTEDDAPLLSEWHTNWMMVIVAGLYGLGLLAGVVWLLRRSRRPRSDPPPSPQPGEERLQGLGGWLILVGLGVCLSPLRIVGTFVADGNAYFSGVIWQEVAMPKGGSYHPLFGPLLVGELVGNMTLLALWGSLVILFFSKSRLFPRLYLATLGFSVVFLVGDELLARQIPDLAGELDPESAVDLTRVVLGALIWGPYMVLSRRVKLTFIR